jgi:hypothetical protein
MFFPFFMFGFLFHFTHRVCVDSIRWTSIIENVIIHLHSSGLLIEPLPCSSSLPHSINFHFFRLFFLLIYSCKSIENDINDNDVIKAHLKVKILLYIKPHSRAVRLHVWGGLDVMECTKAGGSGRLSICLAHHLIFLGQSVIWHNSACKLLSLNLVSSLTYILSSLETI